MIDSSNKVRGEINASLRSQPEEYIPEFPLDLYFMPYHHIKVLGNIITYAVN